MGHFLIKSRFFCEKVGPSILHTFIAFWLDFQGPGPPGRLKKREKTVSENLCFSELKRAPETFFSDFLLFWGLIFGALFGHFGDFGATYFREGVRGRFGTVFGSILEVFWTDLGRILV